jgi:hypothetical protein
VRELGEVLDETGRGGRSHIVADRHKLHAAALFSAMTHVHDRDQAGRQDADSINAASSERRARPRGEVLHTNRKLER